MVGHHLVLNPCLTNNHGKKITVEKSCNSFTLNLHEKAISSLENPLAGCKHKKDISLSHGKIHALLPLKNLVEAKTLTSHLNLLYLTPIDFNSMTA